MENTCGVGVTAFFLPSWRDLCLISTTVSSSLWSWEREGLGKIVRLARDRAAVDGERA